MSEPVFAHPSESERPHFLSQLALTFSLDGDVMHGEASPNQFLCVPGTSTPRAGVLATYADITTGLSGSELVGSIMPTLDLSIHVFRCPTRSAVTFESRILKTGKRVVVGETWFTARGEADPYAVSIATFMVVRSPELGSFRATMHDEPPFAPPHQLDEPIEESLALQVVAPGVVEVELRDDTSNGSNTVQGGVIALLAERACETLLADAVGPRVVTGLDLRYLSVTRIGPVRATATILRADAAGAQLWVEVRDVGSDDHLLVHVVAAATPFDTFTWR